jgi:hypothetical protein
VQIAFLDLENDELSPQRKGHLFERLTKRLVESSGYGEIVLRAKHSSLEYDIEAVHDISARYLSGEAKAHESNISGQTLAAFIGKLVPIATRTPVDGLFISTSSFTAEARDYLTSLQSSNFGALPLSLKTLVGEEIARFLASRNRCAPDDVIRSRVKDQTGMEPLDVWLVVTDRDDFVVASCAPTAISGASHFSVLQLDGGALELEPAVVSRLQRQLADLQDLQPATTISEQLPPPIIDRIPPVVGGAGWFDYKFPTPPECFIGRERHLSEIASTIDAIRSESTALRAVQILSRSGVGKSSLLLKLQGTLDQAAAMTVDGRNLRVPADTRLVIAQLVAETNARLALQIALPRSQGELQETLQAVGERLHSLSTVAIVQIDQFEALLALPPVFDTVLDLIATSTTRSLPIVWVLARKNDLAATFDESASIDLARLNELSLSIALDDFSPDESRLLLSRLAVELGTSIRPELSNAILTFSAGFPWLHKRLCAHVLSMHRAGISQRDLVQTGLRAEDLFEEDLAGLSEQDKALLRTLAAHLPNTAAELDRRLESEISAHRLTSKLNEFLGRRLLRLSGDVYDTYNDVFKTYLVTERIPFQTRYVFRMTPGACFDLLREIARVGPQDLSRFQRHIGGHQIAVLNKLRELRLLGLIVPQAGFVALSVEAQTALETDSLGELLRRSLRGNGLVLRVLDLLASEDTVSVVRVADELMKELPHLEVSERTWQQYAHLLVAWIRYSGMAYVEGSLVRLRETPSDELLERREFYRGTFAAETFVPSVRPSKVLELVELVQQQAGMSRSNVVKRFGVHRTAGLLRDGEALDLVAINDETVSAGRQARALFARGEPLTVRDVATLALSKPNVRALLEAASDKRLDSQAQRAVLGRFGSAKWTDQTWGWRLGILRSWLVATGQARSVRGGLRAL